MTVFGASLGNYSKGGRERSLSRFRTFAASSTFGNKTSSIAPDEVIFVMTCSIRYYRASRREDAGLLIVKKAEFAAYKARLVAAGYVVLDNLDMPGIEITVIQSI